MGVDDEPQKSSREFSEAIKKISGMSVPEQNRGLKIFESAMEEGNASFTLDEGKGSGTLTVGDEKIKINNPDEAALYLGIQQKANSKRT